MPVTPDTMRMIPPTWAQSHRDRVRTSWNGVCSIIDPTVSTGPVWDEEAGEYTGGENPLIAGSIPCRLQARADGGRGATPVVIAGQSTQPVSYMVSVDVAWPIEKDHMVIGITVPADPVLNASLAGVTMRVREVGKGTELMDRYLYCTEEQL